MRKLKHKRIILFFSICLLIVAFLFVTFQQKCGKEKAIKSNNLNVVEQSKIEQDNDEKQEEKEKDKIISEEHSTEQTEGSNPPTLNNSITTGNSNSAQSNSNNQNGSSSSSSGQSDSNIDSSISKDNDTQADVEEIIDTNSIDYLIHKGRIDCSSAEKCDEKGLPIYFQFKKAIRNLFYVEVLSNKNNSLGYFIEYVFQTSDFTANEECQNYGANIKKTLSDRVIGYTCTLNDSNYELKINTDYS